MSKEKIAELEKVLRSLRDKRQAGRAKAVIVLGFNSFLAVDVESDILISDSHIEKVVVI